MIATESINNYENVTSTTTREHDGVLALPDVNGRRIPYRFFLFADLCLVWASAGLAHLLQLICTREWSSSPHAEFGVTVPLNVLFLFSVFEALIAHTQGLYEFPSKTSYQNDIKLLAETIFCSAVVVGTGEYLGGGTNRGIGALVVTLFLSWILLAAWRKVLRSQSIPGLTGTLNVLIVGFGRTAHELARQLRENPTLGYVVKGFVSRRRSPRPGDNACQEARAELLGTVDEISSIVRAHFIDEILICVPSDRNLVMEITQKAQAAGVRVRVIPDLYDGLANVQPVEYVGPFPALTLCQTTTPTLSLMMKRLMDLALSGFALIVLSPLFALVALIVKLDSQGPVFFRSVTAGKKGVTLVCYKFRTMIQNADALKSSLAHLNERDGIFFKIASDPRITRVGKYLRKYSIDELPQLWNVFKGEMSLVGPRPPACGEFSKYSLEHLCRLDVTPGLTGLWQVSARRDPSFQYCVDLDKEYVRTWSLGLDFKILFRTVGVVLAGTGQ